MFLPLIYGFFSELSANKQTNSSRLVIFQCILFFILADPGADSGARESRDGQKKKNKKTNKQTNKQKKGGRRKVKGKTRTFHDSLAVTQSNY